MFASSCIDFSISHATYIKHPQTDLNPIGINRCIHIYLSIMKCVITYIIAATYFLGC
uniref:Uncharacterized protein n=1 Tax=Picea glauca TaxID=3330 RepID=A0A117NIW5_PICGL|nr:hypothetical protein ABT39_MTgene384 [Picea glauca]